ncbi:MAG: hypothetical protein H0T92_11075, partial [Pyrinomonadaceae bacterium]|nr:hypothetical protein [Pyrinomonadaceae bacterium]
MATTTETAAATETVVETATVVEPQAAVNCVRTIKADIVAFDQVFFYNRFGAVNPYGMMYALRRDVVPIDPSRGLTPGNIQLRADKRPRPLVLRANVG